METGRRIKKASQLIKKKKTTTTAGQLVTLIKV